MVLSSHALKPPSPIKAIVLLHIDVFLISAASDTVLVSPPGLSVFLGYLMGFVLPLLRLIPSSNLLILFATVALPGN